MMVLIAVYGRRPVVVERIEILDDHFGRLTEGQVHFQKGGPCIINAGQSAVIEIQTSVGERGDRVPTFKEEGLVQVFTDFRPNKPFQRGIPCVPA